jgi:hypothetical protein
MDDKDTIKALEMANVTLRARVTDLEAKLAEAARLAVDSARAADSIVEDGLREALEQIVKVVDDERAGYGGTDVYAKLSALHNVEDIARRALGRE